MAKEINFNSLTDPNIQSMASALEKQKVLEWLDRCTNASPTAILNLNGATVTSASQLFPAAQEAGMHYRKACGFASRRGLDASSRRRVRSKLFKARYILDSRIEATILHLVSSGAMPVGRLLRRNVFGYAKKQGVSFRLSLSTCKPTLLCGGGCYAHDGRERVTSTILSGCYNTVLARLWSSNELPYNNLIPHVRRAVTNALDDADLAFREYGFRRRARIRLAHVGELAAFPEFANWLGETIRDQSDGQVDAVVYTRHPAVSKLDPGRLVINLTIDECSPERRKWAGPGVRVVWSAWDGELDPDAEVNFLEHHDNGQHSDPSGSGNVCPVTSTESELRFCDAFGCTRCFDAVDGEDIDLNSHAPIIDRERARTRTFGLLREKRTNEP